MNKIHRCVLVALMATSLVSGMDRAFPSSDELTTEKEAYFNNLELQLVQQQIDIAEKWKQLRMSMSSDAAKNKSAKGIVQTQSELGNKWDKLHQEEEQAINEWGIMDLKHKLAGLIDAFQSENAANEIWGDKAPAESSAMDLVTVHIDTLNSMVGIYTDEVDEKGLPVLQWEMNAESGHIIETSRSKDGQKVQVVEKDSYVGGSHQPKHANKQNTGDLTTSDYENIINIDEEMSDVEKQRDIAFKIMLFFISFMLGAFGLVYWIYKQVESQRQEEVMKQAIKNQRQVSPQDLKQRPFLDFVVGQFDNDSMVINPYARHTGPVTAGQTSRRRVSAQGLGSALSQHCNVDSSPFGARNLAHLQEERGRFDDL